MTLQSLSIRVDVSPAMAAAATVGGDGIESSGGCKFCGQRVGLHGMRIGAENACVLCSLVQSLYRPTIDDEVRMIWLPEMTQLSLNVLVRQIHVELRGLGASVFCEDTPKRPEGLLPVLYTAQRLLLERQGGVSERLGSSRAGDLAEALTALADRVVTVKKLPLGGLRVFPAGRFYVGGINVYDEIVDSWCEKSNAGASSPAAGLMPGVG